MNVLTFPAHAMLKRRCLALLVSLLGVSAAHAVTVDYDGALAAALNGTPQIQTFTMLPVGTETIRNSDIDTGRGSLASLSAFVTDEAEGVSYGAASSGEGEFLSFNSLNLSDTVSVDGDFVEYFITFEILDGSVTIEGMNGGQRAAFGFDVSLNGTSVFDAAVNVERNETTGLQTITSDAGAQSLVGFSEFSGSTTGVSLSLIHI